MARKIQEHTYGAHIYMRLELDGKEYEVSCYCGMDCSWNHFITTADGSLDQEKVVATFKALYWGDTMGIMELNTKVQE